MLSARPRLPVRAFTHGPCRPPKRIPPTSPRPQGNRTRPPPHPTCNDAQAPRVPPTTTAASKSLATRPSDLRLPSDTSPNNTHTSAKMVRLQTPTTPSHRDPTRLHPLTLTARVRACNLGTDRPLQLPITPPRHPPPHLHEHLRARRRARHHGPQQGRVRIFFALPSVCRFTSYFYCIFAMLPRRFLLQPVVLQTKLWRRKEVRRAVGEK